LEASRDIFEEFEDAGGGIERFLSFLQRRFPGYRFQVLSNGAFLGDPLCLVDARGRVLPRKEVAAKVIPVPEMGTTLVVSPGGGSEAPEPPWGFRGILALGVELFLAQERLRGAEELLDVQKRQADRTAKVLEEKYLDILAENQRSHEEMRNQQTLYAQKLNDEIEQQTRALRETNKDLFEAKHILERTNEELERAIEKANRMASEAGIANAAKSQFLAAMSHEIRTPLNAIIGFSEMLLESGLNDEQKEYAGIVKRSSEALLALINDILDLSKVEAGRMTLEASDFSPEGVASDICELVRPTTERKSVALICRVDETVPALVKGDPKRLRQVLINLLGNAAKFTEAGKIELRLSAAQTTDSKVKLLAEVRDTGIGIAEDQWKLIFEPFRQIDGSPGRKYEGTGLGLSIAKKLVELMGGEIWVESRLGQGSVFRFTAWVGRSAQETSSKQAAIEAARPEGLTVAAPSLLKTDVLRVLLAEDNLVNQKLACLMLNKAGVEVEVAGSGREAVEKYTADPRHHRLILMDVQMPGMDGLQATRTIRGWEEKQPLPGRRRVPIIAMTAQAVEGDREKCIGAGMDDYISKPVKKETLLEKIREWSTKESVPPSASAGTVF
jgi:signal transduction histidine kinase/FixJ family two-component response regulator